MYLDTRETINTENVLSTICEQVFVGSHHGLRRELGQEMLLLDAWTAVHLHRDKLLWWLSAKPLAIIPFGIVLVSQNCDLPKSDLHKYWG